MRLFIYVYYEEAIIVPTLDAEKAYGMKDKAGRGEVRKFDIPDRDIARKLPETVRRHRDPLEDAKESLMEELFGTLKGKGEKK